MLGAAHPRRVRFQERLDLTEVQGPPPPPAFALVISGAALPAATAATLGGLPGAAPTPRGPVRPRRTRRLPRRPWPTRAAQPIALQNARRSPHPRFQLSDSRNRRRGTACGAWWPPQAPTEGSQEPLFFH